jgi:hypothetical protein
MSLLPVLMMLLAALAAVQFVIFWAADWLYSPRLWWLTNLIGGAMLFPPLAAWYYLGRSRAPITALALVLIMIEAGGTAAAGNPDLSRLSYSQGFTVEFAMLVLPAAAYFIAATISRAAMRRQR